MTDLAESIGLSVVSRESDGNVMLDEGEEALQTFEDIQLLIGTGSDQGYGRLIITDGRIFWLSSKDPSLALSADFTNISMHAIATDPCSVDRPCLYVQLDTGEEGEILFEEHDEEGDQDPEELSQQLPELRLIPSTASALEALFQAFCDGAVRNPDSFAEEEGQGSLFFDQASALASVLGATALEGGRDDVAAGDAGDDVGDDEMERFEDADEEDSRHPATNGAAS